MYRFALRPRWIVLHLLVLALIVAMIGLMFWQIDRLHQRAAGRFYFQHIRTGTTFPVHKYFLCIYPVACAALYGIMLLLFRRHWHVA